VKQTHHKAGVAVTTGASGGIGSATVQQFAVLGWPLLLCDLRAEAIEKVAAPLRAAGSEIDILAGDIADTAFPAQLLAQLGDREVRALIHVAGLTPSAGDAARILEVNFGASARLVAAMLPKMADGACAVLISSMSAHMIKSAEIDAALMQLVGDDATPLQIFATTPEASYPISKRAVMRLVAREAAAYAARNARIVSISPGLIDTGMGRIEMAASSRIAAILERTPAGRLGRPDEIASAAVMLCSPAASYITGCDIRVDGGTSGVLGFL
jgi:NAD(P)-dependent dehydrogenase (short-subunit alcohol dehydrogenase family)